jgi:signal transduction histidine kinase
MSRLFVILAWFLAVGVAADPPGVKQGVLDMRQWNFKEGGAVPLTGEWRFSWRQLVDPGSDQAPSSFTYFPVPSVWNNKHAGGQALDGFGYATYQLTILLPEDAPKLCLDLPEFHMASALWANGKLIATAGEVGTTRDRELPKSVPQTACLPEGTEIHLVLHISNFYHMEGGILRVIRLGESNQVLGNERRTLLVNVFTMGALMFLGLHYLVFSFSQPQNKEHLLYALLAFLMLVRLAVTHKLTYMFADHPHLLSTRLSYTTVFLVPTLYIMFLYCLYPNEINRRFAQSLVVVGILGTFMVWITEARIFTWVRDYCVVATQVLIVYAVGVVLIATLRRRTDALIMLAIVLVFSSTVLFDTFLYQRVLYASDISPYGFLVFIFGHAAILGRRTNRATVKERAARQELAELSATLQSRIEARTADLAKAKEYAELANQAKSRFLLAASHDLRQPLHALNLFTDMLPTSIARGTWPRAVTKIKQSLQTIDRHLIEVGEVGRLQSGSIAPEITAFSLQVYFEVLFDEFELEAARKNLQLKFVSSTLWCNSDIDLIGRILRNLISNAIKYTDRGRIIVGCRRSGAELRIEVWDTGIGIPISEHKAIFEEFYRHDRARAHAPGLGLGLATVHHLANLLGHSVTVRSTPGKGTCFGLSVPRGASSVDDNPDEEDSVEDAVENAAENENCYAVPATGEGTQ